MSDAVYTLMHNVMNGLPRSFRVLDRRILSFPDAVRGEMAASIPWMAALERWMAPPNAGCPLFCVPGGSDPQDGGSGSKMAAREDKKPAGYVGQPLGKARKAPGTQDGRPDSEKRRRAGKNGAGKLQTGLGSPTFPLGRSAKVDRRPLDARDSRRADLGAGGVLW